MKKIRNFMNHPLFSGSAIMIGGSMVANVINYVYHLVVGRMLGPVNYGILASIFSILYIVSIVPTSTSMSIVKFIASAKTKNEMTNVYKAINKFVLIIAVAMAFIMAIVSKTVASFLHIDNTILIFLIAPILFFSVITLVNQATSQGVLNFMGSILPGVTSSLLKIIFGILLIYLGYSVFGAMVGVVIGAIVAYLVSLPYVSNFRKAKQSGEYDIKPFLRYSIPVLIQALAFTSLFTTDVLLVKHFLSPFDAGLYAALSTLGKIVFFASSPITSVMFPVVAGRFAKGENYLKVFWAAFGLTAAVSAGIVVVYYLFSDFAIKILYGNSYLLASPNLIWMGIFIMIYTLTALLTNFSLSLGKTGIIVFPIVAAILQVILIWIFHAGIREVLVVSLGVSLLTLFGEAGYLSYNRLLSHAKK